MAGFELAVTQCPTCAAVNRPDAEQCDICGAALTSSAATGGRSQVRPVPVLPDRGPRRVAYHVGNSRVRPNALADVAASAEPAILVPTTATGLSTPEPTSSFAPDAAARRDPASCVSCGRLLLPDRRYCGCGAERALATAPASDQVADETDAREAPARAMRSVLRRNRRFHAAMRAANNGARARFDAPLSASTRGLRWTASAAVVALVASQVGGFGRQSRHWGVTHVPFVSQLFYSGIPVRAAKQTAGHATAAPALMFAKSPSPWTGTWRAASVTDCTALQNAPAAASITFGGVYNVDLIDVRAGLSQHDAKASTQYRPKQLDVGFTDGSCETLGLADTANVQRFVVPKSLGRQAKGAVVAIVSAYPPASGSGAQISIRSIEFETLRWSN